MEAEDCLIGGQKQEKRNIGVMLASFLFLLSSGVFDGGAHVSVPSFSVNGPWKHLHRQAPERAIP